MGWIFEILFEKNIRIIRFVLNRSYLLNNFRIRLLIKGRKWNRRLHMYIYIYGYSIIEMHDRYYEKSKEKVGRGSRIRNYDFDRNGHVDRTWVSFMKVARRSRRWRQLW